MSRRDRVLDALSGRQSKVPPVAIFTQSATLGMMLRTGVHWPEAHIDPVKMAILGSAQADIFGTGTVRVPFDITAEAERIGCHVDYGAECNPPSIVRRAFALDPMGDILPDVRDLPSPLEFIAGGRPQVVADAVSLRSRREDVAVTAGILGPVSLLAQVMGAENMAMATLLEPDWSEEWCSALSKILEGYAGLLDDSGADILSMVEAVASPDVLDPAQYMRFSGSKVRSILANVRARTVLHMCGSTEPILGDISRTGADAFNPDPKVLPEKVIEGLGGRMAAVGSVDPVGTLLFGSPEQVREDAHRYRDAGFAVIAPGCGLAPMTPDGNLAALSGAFASTI